MPALPPQKFLDEPLPIRTAGARSIYGRRAPLRARLRKRPPSVPTLQPFARRSRAAPRVPVPWSHSRPFRRELHAARRSRVARAEGSRAATDARTPRYRARAGTTSAASLSIALVGRRRSDARECRRPFAADRFCSGRRGLVAPAALPSPSSGLLGREVLQIDRARGALAGGDAGRALRELDIYAQLEQTGVLSREARVLRIDALERLGRSAEVPMAVDLSRGEDVQRWTRSGEQRRSAPPQGRTCLAPGHRERRLLSPR